jgi:hypothetical protein
MLTGPSWRAVVVEALDERGIDDLATQSVEALKRGSELVRADPELQELAHRSAAANLQLVADLGAGALTLDELESPAAVAAFAREFARRNVPMTELALAYRVGQHTTWRFGIEQLRRSVEDPAELAAIVEEYTDATFATGEVLMARALDRYVHERDRWVRSAGAVRRAVLDELLGDGVSDVDAASARLGYELRRAHVAFVVWAEADDAVLEAAATAVGGHGALIIPLRAGVVGGWCAPEALDPQVGGGAGVAVGLEGHGAAGFRDSHFQALEARRVARLPGARETVIDYADCALVALLTCDLRQAREFVQRELGALAAPDQARLAETALRVLLAQGSPRRAAAELALHENTVAKRVRAAEQLLGRALDERPAETLAALTILPALAIRD